MIWSLLKIVIFVTVVAALAILAGMLMETESGVRLSVADTEFTLGPLQAAIAFVVLILAVWLLIKLSGLLVATLRFLNGDETAVSRYFDRNRERKGYEALADGMLAVASGEGRQALSKAAKAEKYLNRPDLTNLLSAQAAEMTGDRDKAKDVYKRLLSDNRTRFVGVRGLMRQKLSEGDTETALRLAEKAFALKPKHEEMQDTLLQLQASHEDWSGARKTLGAKLRHGSLPRDVHKRRDAVLALSEARDVLAEGKSVEAREAAIEANRLSPDLIPAAVLAAHSYVEQAKPRKAVRVLTKAWAVSPHPDIAAAYAAIVPDETADERIKRFNALLKISPDHVESKLLESELYIAAEDFPAARKSLGDIYVSEPTARSLTIMAAIERGEGSDDAVVRGWLTRALTATRGPQWVCDNCQRVHGAWSPTCTNCDSFDTLSWRTPEGGEIAMPGGTEMLPLIVGTPAEIEDSTAAEPAIVIEDSDSESDDDNAVVLNPVSPPDIPDAELLGEEEPGNR